MSLMAYKRKFKSGLFSRNVKRGFRKSYGRLKYRRGARMSRRSGDKVHQYVQNANQSFTVGNTTLTTPLSIGADTGFAITPALQDLPQASTLTALYDQYRLWRIRMTFRLINNNDNSTAQTSTGSSTNPTTSFPTLWIVPDHDDSSAPTLASIKEYSRVKQFVLRPNSLIKYSFRPNVLSQLYDGAITTAYKLEKPGGVWVDCSQTSVPHYGLKFFVTLNGQPMNASYPYIVQIEAKYHVAMKCIR